MRNYKAIYDIWCKKVSDEALLGELKGMSEKEISDCFYKDLEFGTGGLRGELGAGTNNLNIYTIRKVSEGVARYEAENNGKSVAIAYDSRIKSDLFAKESACVFAAHGLKVYMTPALMPTPFLSFMTRYYHCDAGVMITASHNPKQYNGYKVYGADGCQVTDNVANKITEKINAVDCFEVEPLDFEEAVAQGKIVYTDEKIKEDYLKNVYASGTAENAKGLKVTYSALNGTGIMLVPEALRHIGVEVKEVAEQCVPDGNFPTCPYPNPEKPEALSLGMAYAEKNGSDLLIATDPDADRIGVVVKTKEGNVRLTGNETGILLCDFILSGWKKNVRPVVIKTIVTTKLIGKICKKFGADMINVYTGFKYIGEQIGLLEKKGEEERFALGFEESYGYLTGTYVRDKDAVVAAVAVCEMAAELLKQGKTLADRLEEIYKEYGYVEHQTLSYRFEGSEGSIAKAKVLNGVREGRPETIGGLKVEKMVDYLHDETGLQKSDVMRFDLEKEAELILRPSGTEPLIKAYITACGDKESNKEIFNEITEYLNSIMN